MYVNNPTKCYVVKTNYKIAFVTKYVFENI